MIYDQLRAETDIAVRHLSGLRGQARSSAANGRAQDRLTFIHLKDGFRTAKGFRWGRVAPVCRTTGAAMNIPMIVESEC